MKIPKSFKLMGQTITVSYDGSVNYQDNCQGWAKYRTNQIVLMPKTENTPITQEQLEANFCHELMHFILYFGGEDSFEPLLHQREYFVDRLAGLLHQALSTLEFKEEVTDVD